MATIAEIYLEERGGDPQLYRKNLETGQRIGQAFFNALSLKDRNRLIGSIYDPFYKTDGIMQEIEQCIQWLLDTEEE